MCYLFFTNLVIFRFESHFAIDGYILTALFIVFMIMRVLFFAVFFSLGQKKNRKPDTD